MSAPNPRWLARRQALHQAFVEVCRPPDASWLAFMGRHRRRHSTAEVAQLWAAADRDPGQVDAVNHVYVHVPFCKSICSFCNYERLQPRHPDLLRAYEARLLQAIEQLGPATRGIPWHTLYFGGGTPSVLPADMLGRIVSALDQHLDFVPGSSRYFELDPAVMSTARLDTLVAHGFHHVSFGIQTLEASVNADHSRGSQDRDVVGQRFSELRQRGIQDISCDFLFGLAGTSVDQILAEVRETVQRWRPTWVDIYQLTPSYAYLDSHFGGSRAAFDQHMVPFLQRGPAGLAEIADRFGYRFSRGEGHAISMMDIRTPPIQPDGTQPNIFGEHLAYTQLVCEQDAPLHMLGLGTSARSRIFGGGWFEYRDPDDEIRAAGPASWLGSPVDLRDEVLSYLAHDLRDTDSVDRGKLRRIFGQAFDALFPQAVAAWKALGKVVEDRPDALLLQREGRLERLSTLLWLVVEERLEWELAKHADVPLDPERLAARIAPIGVGTTFGGWRVLAFSPARIHLSHRLGQVRLRLRPSLSGGPPRLVLEDTPPPASADELRSVVRILKRALAARAPA